jgi:predicted dehydrogenase
MKAETRRVFLKNSVTAFAGSKLLRVTNQRCAASPNEKIIVGCVGIRGRGGSLLHGFSEMTDVEVAVICDIDTRLFKKYLQSVSERQSRTPSVETDFRRLMDRPELDAIVIGTPDHWHAIPSVTACQAGKHVYVEKPAGHNHHEGEAMLAASRRYKKVMQVGIQSRSGEHFSEAMEYLRTGALGKVHFARAWESTRQGSLNNTSNGRIPLGVDYEMWLGPAPVHAFNANRFHSSWRWFFDYGTGDLGNDGVHRIDYARRGLEAAIAAQGQSLPRWPSAVSSGGFNVHEDSQEWPNNMIVTWEYPQAILSYELRTWVKYPFEGEPEGAGIYGENGYVIIGNRRWRALGHDGQLLASGSGDNEVMDPAHKRNFVDSIRTDGMPNCDIDQGHISSSLCHFGNLAWRVGRKLRFNSEQQCFVNDSEATRLLGRTYRKPWILPDIT